MIAYFELDRLSSLQETKSLNPLITKDTEVTNQQTKNENGHTTDKSTNLNLSLIPECLQSFVLQHPELFSGYSVKTGSSITQLDRPFEVITSSSTHVEGLLSKESGVDLSHPRLFDAYQAMFDYIRGMITTTLGKFNQVLAFLFPAAEGYGVSDTLTLKNSPFTLVRGIKHYNNYYQDQRTQSIIAFSYKTAPLIPITPRLLLELLQLLPPVLPEAFLDLDNAEVNALVQLGGQYLEDMTLVDQWRLIQALNTFELRPSRLDPKIDFPKSDGVIKGLEDAHRSELIRGVKQGRPFEDVTEYGSGVKPRTGYEFGSRTSDCYIRAYHTISKHAFDAERLEAEFKGKKVKVLWEEFSRFTPYPDLENDLSRISNEEFSRVLQVYLANIVMGQVTPYESITYNSNGSFKDCVIAPFWKCACKKVLAHSPRKIVIKAPEKSVAKTHGWFYRGGIWTALAMFQDGLGSGFYPWLSEGLKWAKSRFKDEHRGFIEQIKKARQAILTSVLGDSGKSYDDFGTIATHYRDCSTERITPQQLSNLKAYWNTT